MQNFQAGQDDEEFKIIQLNSKSNCNVPADHQ